MEYRNGVFLYMILVNLVSIGKAEVLCQTQKDNLPGYCIKLRECPLILNDLKNGLRDYTLCDTPDQPVKSTLVCCPNSQAIILSGKNDRNDYPLTRKHQIKCKEYQKAVYLYVKTVSLANQPHVITEKNQCGHKEEALIVGGSNAGPREFPHMASIGVTKDIENNNMFMRKTSWLCGGSLISERYILTAAHCFRSMSGTPNIVRVGELDFSITNDEADPEDFFIEKLIPHPHYMDNSSYNDIGLIKLNRDVNISPWKRPACLPSFEINNTIHKAIATGWGNTYYGENKFNDHLLKVTVEKFSHEECASIYQQKKNLTETQICYGSHTHENDTCQGDSGGPLQIYLNHKDIYCMYEIVGVTSFGIFCGIKTIPAVYTKVYNYVDWIESVVWGESVALN